MLDDHLIMIMLWIVGLLSFVVAVPKNQKRRFLFAFLVCQTLTWLNSLLQVNFHLYKFPVREFPKATDINLAMQYLFFPLACGFYMIFEPKKRLFIRTLYLFAWVTLLVVCVVGLEQHTNIIKFTNYSWYWTWVDTFCVFIITNWVFKWFFKKLFLFQSDQEAIR